MEHVDKDWGLRIYSALVVMLIGAILSAPFWAWGATTWRGPRLGIAQPAVGDVGWADINDRNHLITEIVLVPILDGHLVVSGATPADSGGLVLSWDAGWIKFSGVSYYLVSGATTLGNNDVNWVSAVTDAATSGATVRVNTGEAYPPSAASGYFTPLAIAFTEAGDIVRMGDLRYMPRDHSDLHERTGIWEVDGDHLDIDFTPTVYTPSTSPAEADNADDLAAHLSGIDQKLATSGQTDYPNHWTATQIFSGVSANTIITGLSPFVLSSAVTATGDMLANGVLFWNAAAMGGVTLPGIGTGATEILLVKVIGAGGVTVFTENDQSILNEDEWGQQIWVPPGNLGHQVSLKSIKTGTCTFWAVIGSVGSNWEMVAE